MSEDKPDTEESTLSLSRRQTLGALGVAGLGATGAMVRWRTERDQSTDSDSGPATVKGTVVFTDGRPVTGARVSTNGTVVETNSDGQFTLAGLEPGRQTVNIGNETIENRTIEVTANADSAVDIGRVVVELLSSDIHVTSFDAGVTDGGVVLVGTTLQNDGREGTTTVEVSVGGKRDTQRVFLAAGESESLSAHFHIEDDPANTVAEISTGESTQTDNLDQRQYGEFIFELMGSEGFLAFDADTIEEVETDGFAFPQNFRSRKDSIRIIGELDPEAGTWQATQTTIPDLETDSGIHFELEPTDLSGEFDPGRGVLTAEGELDMVVDGDSFSFDVAMTTRQSGALSGDMSLDGWSPTATLVDNEFTVEDTTGNALVDSFLGLPLEESGRAWLELTEMRVEIDELRAVPW